MPIYAYYCEKCDKEVEFIESMEDREKEHMCEDCGNVVVPVIGKGVAFKFRGTGFYCTDYITKKNGDLH